MARFRRQFRRPIVSIKHIIDKQAVTALGVQDKTVIIDAQENPLLANTDNVKPGCKVFSFYLNVIAVGLGAQGILNNIYMIIYKIPGANITGSAIPDGNVTGSDNFKRQIFHTEMRMLNDTVTSQPISIFNGVIKIPKVFQTMRIDDFIQIQLFTPGGSANYCIECIYKEYQ